MQLSELVRQYNPGDEQKRGDYDLYLEETGDQSRGSNVPLPDGMDKNGNPLPDDGLE